MLYASLPFTCRKGGLEQVTGLEPVPSAWQAEILTDYTIPAFGISGARAGPALSSVTTPESGADSPIRTDEGLRRAITSRVQSTTMRYRQMDPVMVIETTSAVWKTAILAVELHRVIKISLSSLYKYYIKDFEKNQIFMVPPSGIEPLTCRV